MDAIHPVDTLTLCGLLLLKPFTLAAGTVHASAQMLGTAKETEKTRFDASRDTPHISHQTLSTAHCHELIQALFCSVLEFGPVPRPDSSDPPSSRDRTPHKRTSPRQNLKATTALSSSQHTLNM